MIVVSGRRNCRVVLSVIGIVLSGLRLRLAENASEDAGSIKQEQAVQSS